MQEKTLLRIAMCTTLLGLTALLIIMQTTQAREILGNNTMNSEDGDSVKITGVIKRVNHGNNVTQLVIEHQCLTKAVSFENMDAEPGSRVQVEGKIQENSFFGKAEKQVLIERVVK